MSDTNEIDDITREFRQLGHAAASAVAQWQRNNPGKTKVPRKVRKEASFRLREAMRAHERMLAEQRISEQAFISESIQNHRSISLGMGQSAPGTPEQYAHQQWEHAQWRHAIATQIHQAQHLSHEERGQAVMALTSAHYADNPNVPQRPVWGAKPRGISALKARLAERVSRAWEGMQQPQSQQRTVLKPIPKPRGAGQPRAWAAPGSAADHPYWRSELPVQDQAMNARMAEMEAQLRELAEYREREQRWIAERDALHTEVTDLGEALTEAYTERDRLQAKVADLGEKVLDVRQQHKDVADQLAQRGQELTEAHTELTRVRGERDEAVQKLVKRTPAGQRYGSPERQAEQAKVAARTPLRENANPATPEAPAESSTPEAPESPQTPGQPEGVSTPAKAMQARTTAAPEAPAQKSSGAAPEQPDQGNSSWSVNVVNGDRMLLEIPQDEQLNQERERLVGAGAGRRINGSRKVAGYTAPEIPLPDAPFDGPEPPEFDR